jgi:uncharacterized protein
MDPLPLDSARVARELKLTPEQVTRTVALLDDGNTVPFITRYRKEQTGNLDEEQIRAIQRSVKSQRQVAERAAAGADLESRVGAGRVVPRGAELCRRGPRPAGRRGRARRRDGHPRGADLGAE